MPDCYCYLGPTLDLVFIITAFTTSLAGKMFGVDPV